MAGAGCIPDLANYGSLIGEMSELQKTADVMEMMKGTVVTLSLSPRQDRW